MFNTYDNVYQGTSVTIQSFSGTTAVIGSAIDTEGLDNGMIHVRAEAALGSPSAATATYKIQECATSGGTYADAKDNTGTVIGGTLDVHAAAADGFARVEGLGLNRLRFLKIVITPAFTGGTTPTFLAYGEFLASQRSARPTRSTVSNT